MRYLTTLCAAVALQAPPLQADASGTPPTIYAPLSIAVFSPLDSLPAGYHVISHLQFNMLYGSAYGLRGLALGVGANRAEADMTGVQFAAGTNLVGNDGRGLQLSGFYNRSGGAYNGVQIATVNQAKSLDSGVQWGLVDIAGKVGGLQFSLVNIGDNVRGAQIATVNVADDVNGLQLAFVNAADEVNGSQIGLVNIGDELSGAQIGLVNVSSHNALGGQFGFVNVDSSNWFRLYTAFGRGDHGAIGVRSGSRWFFGDVGLATHGQESGRYSRKVSLMGGVGIWHPVSVFSLALQLNREATARGDRAYALPFTMTFPMGGPVEGYGASGPAFDARFNYRQMDWLVGMQITFREQTVKHPRP